MKSRPTSANVAASRRRLKTTNRSAAGPLTARRSYCGRACRVIVNHMVQYQSATRPHVRGAVGPDPQGDPRAARRGQRHDHRARGAVRDLAHGYEEARERARGRRARHHREGGTRAPTADLGPRRLDEVEAWIESYRQDLERPSRPLRGGPRTEKRRTRMSEQQTRRRAEVRKDGDREISVERIFDAPRDLVFKALHRPGVDPGVVGPAEQRDHRGQDGRSHRRRLAVHPQGLRRLGDRVPRHVPRGHARRSGSPGRSSGTACRAT